MLVGNSKHAALNDDVPEDWNANKLEVVEVDLEVDLVVTLLVPLLVPLLVAEVSVVLL